MYFAKSTTMGYIMNSLRVCIPLYSEDRVILGSGNEVDLKIRLITDTKSTDFGIQSRKITTIMHFGIKITVKYMKYKYIFQLKKNTK